MQAARRAWRPILPRRACMMLGLLAAACDSDEQEMAPEPLPEVTVTRPVQREVTDWDEFTGRFVGVERVEVRARVSGYLDAVEFMDGQVVQRGQRLFRIDPRPALAAVAEAEGRLADARSQFTLAERELARTRSLAAARAASEASLDQRAQALEAARANLAQAEAARQRIGLDLEFTEVRAPIGGRIGRHLVSPGNLVSGGEGSAATLLATIVTIDPIDFAFDIDQAAGLRYVRLAQSGDRPSSREMANPVRLALADETEFAHEGRVVFVDNEADAGTGTIRLRARFANPRELFLPNGFARVRLIASAPYQAVLVPEMAIATDQSRRVVYVLGEGDRLEARQVELGAQHDGLRVIRKGLTGAEEIVTAGMTRARAGQQVRPRRREATPAP